MVALPCPPSAAAGLNACSLTTYGQDGAGRRMEAVLTCVAVATELNLQYVHTPFHVLQHGVDAAQANSFLGLQHLSSCWPSVRVQLSTPRCGKCPPAAIAADNGASRALDAKYIIEDEVVCGAQPSTRSSRSSNSNTNRAAAANRTSLLAELSSASSRCVRDGKTVNVAYHCFHHFWCTTVRARNARAWFDVLPALRAAYFAAHDLTRQPSPSSQLSSVTTAAGTAAAASTVVVVGMHHRSVKRRRLSNVIYVGLVSLLRERHAAYLRAHPTSNLRLEFLIHSDTRVPAAIRNNSTAPAGMLLTLARARDVRLRTPDDIDALSAMHELSLSDVLIPSESSFSMVPALLGNMTVLLPACFSRAPLPHWLSIPCTGDRGSAASAVRAMPWPPASSESRSRGAENGMR